MGRRPFASPCRTTERSDDRTSVKGSKRQMNVQRKISIPTFLLYALKFLTKLPTLSNGRDTNITRGLPRMSTSLDILLTRPLRTLETKGAKYGHKTLNKTRRTSRPYTSIATVFLFTRKIILNAPPHLRLRHLPSQEGFRGARLQNLPQRRSCQVAQVDRTARTTTKI